MTINITVLIQIINFFVAYVILERIFLSYGMSQVRVRDETLRRRQLELAENKGTVESLRIEMQKRWRQYQESLQSRTPSLAASSDQRLEDQLRQKPMAGMRMSGLEEKKLIDELKNALIKKVWS